MDVVIAIGPTEFDGWFLGEHLSTTIGVPMHKRMSYDAVTQNLIISTNGLTQGQIDGIVPAVASYVEPAVDAKKNLGDVITALR